MAICGGNPFFYAFPAPPLLPLVIPWYTHPKEPFPSMFPLFTFLSSYCLTWSISIEVRMSTTSLPSSLPPSCISFESILTSDAISDLISSLELQLWSWLVFLCDLACLSWISSLYSKLVAEAYYLTTFLNISLWLLSRCDWLAFWTI